jgi:hypothetical protein
LRARLQYLELGGVKVLGGRLLYPELEVLEIFGARLW